MARSFNGTTDELAATVTLSSTVVAPVSAMVWANNGVAAAGLRIALMLRNASLQLYMRVGGLASNTMEFGYWNGSSDHRVASGTTMTVGTWYCFVGTYDGTTYRIYTNGGTPATAADATGPSFAPLNEDIGYQDDTGSRFWNGSIAEVAWWNVVLTSLEASALAAGVRARDVRPSALRNWWPLDGLTTPEPDLWGAFSGSGKANLTATGTASAFGPPLTLFTPPPAMGGIFPVSLPPPFTLMPQIVT